MHRTVPIWSLHRPASGRFVLPRGEQRCTCSVQLCEQALTRTASLSSAFGKGAGLLFEMLQCKHGRLQPTRMSGLSHARDEWQYFK